MDVWCVSALLRGISALVSNALLLRSAGYNSRTISGTSGSGVCDMRGLGFQYFSSKVSCDMAIAGLIVCKLENPS